jgi:hypothetical protein
MEGAKDLSLVQQCRILRTPFHPQPQRARPYDPGQVRVVIQHHHHRGVALPGLAQDAAAEGRMQQRRAVERPARV